MQKLMYKLWATLHPCAQQSIYHIHVHQDLFADKGVPATDNPPANDKPMSVCVWFQLMQDQ